MVTINFPYTICGEKELEIIDWCCDHDIEIDNHTLPDTSLIRFEDDGMALFFAIQFGLTGIDK